LTLRLYFDQNRYDDGSAAGILIEEVAQGIYSNLAVITHSASEFVVDFVRIMPGIPKAIPTNWVKYRTGIWISS
jgi:hypothetical protein